MHHENFADALSQSPTAEVTAVKRLVIEFEAALARMMVSGRVDEEVDGILEKFIVDDYLQHDPNVPGYGRAFLAAGFRRIPLTGDVPPPPVALIVEGDFVCLLMQKPLPDPTTPARCTTGSSPPCSGSGTGSWPSTGARTRRAPWAAAPGRAGVASTDPPGY